MKSGILLVAYGSGNLRGAATLRAVQAAAESRFGLPVRWAFTSETMRLRLARSRTKSDSVLKALNRMRFERYTHVAVQTLHVIPGMEYEGVAADCRIAGEGSLSVSLGAPLLSESGQSESALSAAASALLRHISPLRAAGEPVVCMAHGSRHECDVLYSRMAEKVRSLDPFIHVACMVGRGIPRRPPRKPPHSPAAPRQAETHPDGLDLLLPLLTADSLSPRRVWLLPLLSLVGRHTLEDMAGPSPDSWKSRLEHAGFECRAELRGLADDPVFVKLWLDRLEAALARLNAPPALYPTSSD